jgi:phosphate transport system substrate-binding protein
MPKNGMLIRISLALGAVAILATVAVTAAGAARQSVTLSGAGSTFVQPLISTWTAIPSQSGSPFTHAKGITVNYGGGGSGAGVSDITNKTVDFGASDAPLRVFSPTCKTCVQIPWALSGTAVIYRIDGVSATLKMSGPVLANIYLDKISYWNDPAIKALNKGVNLPHLKIVTVHRDSSSGTTFNFTDFLSNTSSAFRTRIGASTFPGDGGAHGWPTANPFLEGHGSSGVAGKVAGQNGSVGYVDLYYGITAGLKFMKVENQSGVFVSPSLTSIAIAAKSQKKPYTTGELSIVNPPNSVILKNAYPISTYTYVDVQKHSGAKAASLRTFLTWAITTGQTGGPSPGYAKKDYFVPLPPAIVTFDKSKIPSITN